MRCVWQIWIATCLILQAREGFGQRVFYSPVVGNNAVLQFNVAGKAGEYYWIQIEKKKRNFYRNSGNSWRYKQQDFEVYDTRMNRVRTVAGAEFSDSVLKEYFVASDNFFDQLTVNASGRGVEFILHRFSAAGDELIDGKSVAQFPFREGGDAFLMARSANKSKILLLGFETMPDEAPRIHALLFNSDWQLLRHNVYHHSNLTQPIIQDDFISYPIESFNNNPIKLTNAGEWLMAARSRSSRNYLLFHFNTRDSSILCKEIKLPANSTLEDLALLVDEPRREVFAGILSRFRYRAVKNVQVIHYSMDSAAFDFDSSYRFNTLVETKVKNENLVQESFTAIPGKGFMLLKEYGRNFPEADNLDYANMWDPDVIMSNNVFTTNELRSSVSEDGYTRYNQLGSVKKQYSRGDLSVFYFPAHKADSCWSGVISKEQLTELNSPYLSYLLVPTNDKLFFLYNSFTDGTVQFGSTTALDNRGNLLPGEGVAFWKYNNTLSFQQSRQISENEIAIPYEKYRRNGFAIIRF